MRAKTLTFSLTILTKDWSQNPRISEWHAMSMLAFVYIDGYESKEGYNEEIEQLRKMADDIVKLHIKYSQT